MVRETQVLKKAKCSFLLIYMVVAFLEEISVYEDHAKRPCVDVLHGARFWAQVPVNALYLGTVQ